MYVFKNLGKQSQTLDVPEILINRWKLSLKLIGNSLYGRCVMNQEKHIGTTYSNDNNITKKINESHFQDLQKISDESYEVFSSKIKIKMDVPIQVGCAVYDLAKLRMLEYYHDFIDKYIDLSDFVYAKWTRIALILPSALKILKIYSNQN